MDSLSHHSNFILRTRVCCLSSCGDVKYQPSIIETIRQNPSAVKVKVGNYQDFAKFVSSATKALELRRTNIVTDTNGTVASEQRNLRLFVNLKGRILQPLALSLIRNHFRAGKLVFSVCTGALLLQGGGVLLGRQALRTGLPRICCHTTGLYPFDRALSWMATWSPPPALPQDSIPRWLSRRQTLYFTVARLIQLPLRFC
jgi:hypothetical protein